MNTKGMALSSSSVDLPPEKKPTGNFQGDISPSFDSACFDPHVKNVFVSSFTELISPQAPALQGLCPHVATLDLPEGASVSAGTPEKNCMS